MRQIGILQVLLSGVCFGFLGVFGKWAYAAGLEPGEFLALRFLTAAGLLALWLLARERRAFRLERKYLMRCAALGVLGYALFSSFFFHALRGLTASLTVLLLYTYPVMVSLGAWALFREKLRPVHAIALPLVMLGLFLLVYGDFGISSELSLLFGVLAAVFYSVYILASSRWLRGVPPLHSVFYIMLSAGIALGFLHLRPSTLVALPSAAPAILGTALIGTLAAMSLFLAGLQKLSNAEVSVLSTAEPITGVLLATLLLGERMLAVQVAGGALILLGMVLTSLRRT